MTLRWGIVTAGKIANDFVNAFNSYPEIGDQAIVAVAARDKTRAAEFAKLHNIPKVFDSYQALATSSDIDIAYIGSLHPEHYELSMLFLENGKHILCEKPFCLNAKQAASVLKLAKKKNLFAMEAIWTRHSPAYMDLDKELASGSLGEIEFVQADFGIYSEGEKAITKSLGGSAVLDVGVYCLQLALFVFKEEPKKVTAIGNLYDTGVDETETIIMDYGNGRRAVFNTHTKLEMWNKATIYGTKGHITFEAPFHFPHKVILSDGSVKDYPLHSSNLPYNFVNSPGLVYQALEAARCIKAGLIESPRLPHSETLLIAKLEDTVREQLGVHYDVDDKEYP